MERESFKSRLGFLLVSAGCAVGIGNVWRFPFIVGQNGGGLSWPIAHWKSPAPSGIFTDGLPSWAAIC